MLKLGLGVVLALTIVSVWTHDVPASLERHITGLEQTYAGPVGGVIEDKAASVDIGFLDDIDPEQIRALIAGGLTCTSATTYLCNQHTPVSNVAVTNVTNWVQGPSRYCVAQCKVNSAYWAFVVLVNEGPVIPAG